MKRAPAAQMMTVQTGMMDGICQNGKEKLLSVIKRTAGMQKLYTVNKEPINQPSFKANDPHSLMQIYA
jgi:hypothetical protein